MRKKRENPKTTVSLIESLNPAISKRVFKATGERKCEKIFDLITE